MAISDITGRARRLLGAFLAWWGGELAAMVPPRLRHRLAGRRDRLVVQVSDAAVDLVLVRRGRALALGTVPLTGANGDDVADRVRAILAGAPVRRCAVELTLPPERVMQTALDLPSAAERDLESLLAFEMDRLTPFDAEALCFDYRVGGRDAATQRLSVEVAIVQRAVVDDALALAERCGLAPDRVSVRTDDPARPSPWRLVRQPPGGAATRLQRLATVSLAGVAVALVAALIYLPLQRKADAVDRLSQEIASARTVAVAAADLQNRVNTLTRQSHFLEQRKRLRPSVVAVLNELTRVVPDDTWLIRFQYDDGTVQAMGYSGAAAALIGQIGGSPVFEEPAFRAPVMRDQRADAERFHLAFRVAGERGAP